MYGGIINMSIGNKDIKHTASLCKIKIQDEKVEDFKSKMDKILEYASILDKLDTENVKPLYNVLNIENVFREDIIKEGLDINETLDNAPSKDDRSFIVPKML